MTVDVVIRPMRPADESFIRATWLRGYRDTAKGSGEWYYAAQGALIGELLRRHPARVAHYPGDLDQVLGYLVADGPVVHWLYVKGPFRRLGIGRTLLEHEAPGATSRPTTHWTRDAARLAERLHLVRDLSKLRG